MNAMAPVIIAPHIALLADCAGRDFLEPALIKQALETALHAVRDYVNIIVIEPPPETAVLHVSLSK